MDNIENWKKIIKEYSKDKNQTTVQYIDAKLTNVREDYLRSDVELLTGQKFSGMLNKTGEKIYTGQNVKIGYTTTPSKGWIALAFGEADPMGGSGVLAEVENAAVITTNPEDYMVVEELMLDISPETMLYYGNMPAFVIVQGHYCLFSPSTSYVNYVDGHWVIGGIDGLYEQIIANKAKFGSQIGNDTRGGFLYSTSTNTAYPSNYMYQTLNVYSISAASSSGMTYSCRLNQYYATVTAPSGNWWESTLTWGAFTLIYTSLNLTSYAHTSYFSESVQDIFVVPIISGFYNVASTGSLQTPYGYAAITGYIVFASTDGVHYGATYVNIADSRVRMLYAPLISDAENCFTLGISQRTEPIYPT